MKTKDREIFVYVVRQGCLTNENNVLRMSRGKGSELRYYDQLHQRCENQRGQRNRVLRMRLLL